MRVKTCFAIAIIVLSAVLLSNYSTHAEDQNAADDFFVFLPITVNPPEPLPEKTWTGIHLGNTVPPFNAEITPPWPEEMFDLIDPRDGDGDWPAVIVVQSNQLYEIKRSSSGECWVNEAVINPFAQNAFEYVKAAAEEGIPVIVRILPSPGNFLDYDQPVGQQTNHHLVFDEAVTGNHCEFFERPYEATYRSPLDVALEILAIQEFSKNQHGFEIFGFVPANEPNLEWYTNGEETWPEPNVTFVAAWEEMATYFQKVYEWAHLYQDELNIRVMTPPMAQNLFADGVDFFNRNPAEPDECAKSVIVVDSNNPDLTTIGYELMKPYYQLYNDGVTWHNYWLIGRRSYVSCDDGGGHVSYYFPRWLDLAIDPIAKPPVILEADIASPHQAASHPTNPVLDNKDSDVALTSTSIRHFFQLEYCFGGGVHYGANAHIASWLLYDNTKTPEHHWHMGYGFADPDSWPNDEQRPWFPLWWGDSEEPFTCPYVIPGSERDGDAVPTGIELRSQTSHQPMQRLLWGYLLIISLVLLIPYSIKQARK